MRVLAIETSCDETAVAIVEAEGAKRDARFRVLGNALLSQVDIHKEYGGVFPALAKREHAKNLVPLLETALEEAELLHEDAQEITPETRDRIATTLSREGNLAEDFFEFASKCEPPDIDCIAVTAGPGLEPALWVGVNFAKALALLWRKPLVPVNHLEGHILAALAREQTGHKPPYDRVSAPPFDPRFDLVISEPKLPLVALGIAGGHTDLILMRDWLSYEKLGATLDDSVGEAFDKVARMLGLPYPGGPHVSRLAEIARLENTQNPFSLPRPMLHSGTYEFSFSGLKTAVLYLLKSKPDITDVEKRHVAREFEDAVADVLWTKTKKALDESGAQTLVISGGVAANQHIRRTFEEKIAAASHVRLLLPSAALATDNAIMIALAGFYRAAREEFATAEMLAANGSLSLAK